MNELPGEQISADFAAFSQVPAAVQQAEAQVIQDRQDAMDKRDQKMRELKPKQIAMAGKLAEDLKHEDEKDKRTEISFYPPRLCSQPGFAIRGLGKCETLEFHFTVHVRHLYAKFRGLCSITMVEAKSM